MLNYIRSCKKNLSFAFCIIVFCCLLFNVDNQAQAKSFNCLGHNWEQRIADANFKIPKILEVEQDPGELGVRLKANIEVDEEAKPFLYWCANQGSFEEIPGHNNYSEILYIAPEQVVGPIKVKAKLGDNLGAVDYELVLIRLGSGQGDENEENPEDPGDPSDPDLPEDPSAGPSLPFSISPVDGALDIALITEQDLNLSWTSNNSSSVSYAVQLRKKPNHPFVNAFSDNCSDLQDPCILDRSDISSNSVNISSNLFEYETSYVWRIKALVRDLSSGQITNASSWSPNYSFTTAKEPQKLKLKEIGLVSFTDAGNPIIQITIDGQALGLNGDLGDVISIVDSKFVFVSFDKVNEHIDFDGNKSFDYHLIVQENHSNSAGDLLEFDIKLPGGSISRASIFIENDLKRFKNPVLGFNQLNNIDINDDFKVHAYNANLGLDEQVHIVSYKTKEEIDVQNNLSVINNKIVYLSLDPTTNQFSFPEVVFFQTRSSEDFDQSTGEIPKINSVRIAVDSEGRRYIFFVERDAKNTKDTLYYVPHNAQGTSERIFVSSAAKILDADLSIVRSGASDKLLITWSESDSQLVEQVTKFLATDVEDISFAHQYVIANGKSASAQIKIDNDKLKIFALQKGILQSYSTELDNLNNFVAWTNSNNWSQETILTEYLDKNQYKVELDASGKPHVLWVDGSEHKYFAEGQDTYQVLNSPELTGYKLSAIFDFALQSRIGSHGDAYNELHLISRSSDANTKGLHYNFARAAKFFGPSQISASVASNLKPRIVLGPNSARYIFYKAKYENQSQSLQRLMAMIVPALGDEVDHHSPEYTPSVEEVEEHPNSLVCDENPPADAMVCGEDGTTYASECLARKNFTKVAYVGICQTNAELVFEYQDSFTKTTLGELASLTNFSYSFFFEVDNLNNLVMLESPFSPPERDFYQKLELVKLESKNKPVKEPGARIRFLAKSQGGPVSCYSRRVVFPGERHHLALVYDEQKGMNLYVDGLLECNKEYPGPLLRNKRAFVGEIYGDDFEAVQFDGRFDNFRLYKFGLTETEIQEHYQLVTGALPQEPAYELDPFLDIDFEDAVYNSSNKQYEVFDKSSNEFLLINEQHEYYDDRKRKRVYENAFEIFEEEGTKYAQEIVDRTYLNLKIRDNGYIKIPSDQISIAAWIKPSDLNIEANQERDTLIKTSSLDFGLGFCKVSDDLELKQDLIHLSWVHTACIYDGSKLKLYVNGELAGEKEASLDIKSSSLQLSINPKQGMDDIKIYGKALSEDMIVALVNEKIDQIENPEDTTDLQDGLTAYYTFDNLFEDKEVVHQSGALKYFLDFVNGQNVVANRKATKSGYTSPLVSEIDGVIGKAANFTERRSAFIEDTSELGLKDKFTISYLIKGRNRLGNIFVRGSSSTNERFSFDSITDRQTNIPKFSFSSHANRNDFISTRSSDMALDSWRLVTVTYDRGSLKLYQDAVLLSESKNDSIDFKNHNDQPITFKYNASDSYDYTSFAMDELRFYNRALAAEEVTQLMKFYLSRSLDQSVEEQPEGNVTINDLGKFSMFTKTHDMGKGARSAIDKNEEGFLEIKAYSGDTYLFKSFDRSFLDDKKIRLQIANPNNRYRSKIAPIQVFMLDGFYDSDKDFPKGYFKYKGAGIIQHFADIHSIKGSDLAQVVLKAPDLGGSKLKQVTLLIKVPQSETAIIEQVDILDQNDKVVAIFDDQGLVGDLKDAEIGADAQRSESEVSSKALRFNLELREHMHKDHPGSYHDNKYGPGVKFSSYYDQNLQRNVLQLSNGIQNTAQGFIFKSFKKDFLNGKKIKVRWQPYINCGENTVSRVVAAVYEGKYSRKHEKLFPQEETIMQDPLLIIDEYKEKGNDLDLMEKSKRINLPNQDGYATLMLMLEDFDTNCSGSIKVADLEILNSYDEVIAKYSGGGPISERKDTYMDYAITSPVEDDFAPPPIQKSKFSLDLREHDTNRSSRYDPNFSFSASSSGVGISTTNSSDTGYAYAFVSFDKEFLQDKRIRFNWSVNTRVSRNRYYSSYKVWLIDGEYKASNDNLFPQGKSMYRFGRWSKSFRSIKENVSEEVESEPIDVSGSVRDKVTLMFQIYDSSSDRPSMGIKNVEILNEEFSVVAELDKESQLVYGRRNTDSDYASYGEDENVRLDLPFTREVNSLSEGAVLDYSVAQNHAQLGLGQRDNAPIWDIAGINSGSYVFDGRNDFIALKPRVLQNLNDFAISVWLKAPIAANVAGTILDARKSGQEEFVLRNPASLDLVYKGRSIETGINVADGKWHHLIINKESGNLTIYKDAIQEYSVNDLSELKLENDSLSLGSAFAGNIDELKVYSHSINHSQIIKLNSVKDSIIGLQIADFDFAEKVNHTGTSAVKDKSGLNNHGTLKPYHNGRYNSVYQAPSWYEDIGFDGAYEFDKDIYSRQEIEINNVSAYLDTNVGYTQQLWVYVKPGSSSTASLIQGTSNRPYIELQDMQIKPGFRVEGSAPVLADTPSIDYNKWTRLTVTYDGASHKIYIDGQKVYESDAYANFKGFSEFQGKWYIGRGLTGIIDELKIYNYPLGEQEILDSYEELDPSELRSRNTLLNYNFSPVIDSELKGYEVEDFSGAANHASLGLDERVDSKPSSVPFGLDNYSYHFDGNDLIQINDKNALDIQNTLSLKLWVKFDELTNGGEIIAKTIKGLPQGYRMRLGSASRLNFGIMDGSQQYQLDSVAKLEPNQWYHLAATYDNSHLRIYINGQLDSTLEVGAVQIKNPNLPLTVGAGHWGALRYIKATVDDVMVTDYAFSSNEIEDDYKSKLGKINKLVLDLDFNDPSVELVPNSLLDKSGEANHGTLGAGFYYGSIRLYEDRVPMWNSLNTGVNGFYEFDGKDDVISTNPSDSLNLGRSSNEGFSQELWLKPKISGDSSSEQGILGYYYGGYSKQSPSIYVYGNDKIKALFGTGGRYYKLITDSVLEDGKWHHVATTCYEGYYKVFVNGEEEASVKASCKPNSYYSRRFDIGAISSKYFAGGITAVKIYNFGLNAQQIKESYEKSRTLYHD